jgi:cob(I)alamin adenosyltransferase
MEATQEQQLDTALEHIQNTLTEWGLDNWLGHRKPETLSLSADGAINLLDLVNTLTGEIDRLEKIIAYIDNKAGN